MIGGQNNGGVYTIDFASDGIEEFLEVTYVLDSVSPSPDDFGLPSTEANVVVYAAALSPTGPATVAAPALYQAIPAAGNQALISGRLSANASSDYEITIKTAATCDEGVLGEGGSTLGSFTTTTDDVGDSYFSELVPNGSDLDTYVTAEVTGPGGVTSSPSTCIVGGPDNDTWPRALEIGPGTVAGSTVTGYIDDAGRARWYKVPIDPGSRVHVNLSNLPADYDVFVFKDIVQAFTALATPEDLTRLSAEFAPSAFSPSAFSPSAFSPSAFSPSAFSPSAFSPSAFSPSAFSPSAFSPSAFSPSAFSPSAFSPSAFSPSAFSPSAFSPSAFSPSAFSPSAFSAETYASAQIRSLITGSARVGTASETVVADTWNNTGHFYIRVSGKNGESNLDAPFTLGVTLDGSVCDNVSAQTLDDVDAPAGSFKTLVLTDMARMPSSVAGNSTADKAALTAKLETFAERAEIAGDVVDVGARVQALKTQADDHKSCMYAKNSSPQPSRTSSPRTGTNPGLQYVVIVGGDNVIPFFRYPDQSLLGPESDFHAGPQRHRFRGQPPCELRPEPGRLRRRPSPVSLHERFPGPGPAVGRLVETAAEIAGQIDEYMPRQRQHRDPEDVARDRLRLPRGRRPRGQDASCTPARAPAAPSTR